MPALPSQLESILSLWEADPALLDADRFTRRVEIQDELDRLFTDADLGPDSTEHFDTPDLSQRARALHLKFESINGNLFASVRRQIQAGACPAEFASILQTLATPPRGLAYDYLDDLIAGVFQFDPPSEEPRALSSDAVFYQPTPARHIFHLITAAALSHTDTFIDLGSGLGHVPLLVSICTGATSIGIELDPAWIASAVKCATTLNLRNLTFLAEDARHADLSRGTVFYLYTPFTGSALAAVLDSLRIQSALRPIRICTFGPCTLVLREQVWLKPLTPAATDQIAIFVPRA
jgi:hypothetical protein